MTVLDSHKEDIRQENAAGKQQTRPNWTDEFSGMWDADPRSAEEIITDIRSSRCHHDRIISPEFGITDGETV